MLDLRSRSPGMFLDCTGCLCAVESIKWSVKLAQRTPYLNLFLFKRFPCDSTACVIHNDSAHQGHTMVWAVQRGAHAQCTTHRPKSGMHQKTHHMNHPSRMGA